MIGPFTKRPDGRAPDSMFSQSAWDYLAGISKRIQVSGQNVSSTTRGFYTIAEGGGGVAQSTSVKMLVLRDVLDDYLVCANLPTGPAGSVPLWRGSLDADPGSPAENDAYFNTDSKVFKIFFNAEWSEMTVGSTVYVAKQPGVRNSLTGEKILGTNHTYTYGDGPSEAWAVETATRFNKVRSDDDGSTSENQRVIKPYTDGEIIYAIQAKTGIKRPSGETQVDVTFLEILPARGWAGPVT